MEEVFQRFPHLSEDIFKVLDNETLANCEEVSKVWFAHLDDQNFLHLRRVEMIQETIGKFHQLDNEFHLAFDSTRVKNILDAARMGDFETTKKYMIEGIENVYQKSNGSWPHFFSNYLCWAASNGYLDIVKYTVQNTEDSGYPEMTFRNTGIIRYLKYKISEFMTEKSYSPLHHAAAGGHFDIVKYLVDKLSDKNPIVDFNWKTPLHSAASCGRLKIVEYLIGENNDKNPKDRDGDTPLHKAVRNGHLDVVKCIMNNIEDKSPKNNHGRTPIHEAVSYRRLHVFKYIVANIDDKNPKDFQGITPKQEALSNRYSEVVSLYIFKYNL